MHKLSATLLLCCLALAVTAVAAPPEAKEHDDKIVLQNDHVTIWFQGKKPMLKVFPTANASEDGNVSGAYTYKFTEVVEYRDLDGDDAPSNNEVLASLNLEKASAWTVARSELDDGAIVLNLSLRGPVKIGPKAEGLPVSDAVNVSLPDRDADVRLVFTLRDGAATLDAGGVNLTVPGTSVKYDFEVAAWPLVDATNGRIALLSHVEGELDLGSDDDVQTANVGANDTRVGVLAWTPEAQGTDANGAAVDVPVVANARTEGNLTRLAYTYDAPGLATLLHDPTIGVTPTEESLQESGSGTDGQTGGNTVPALGLVGVLAALGVAFIAWHGRR